MTRFKYLFGMYTPNSTIVQPLVDLVIEKNPAMKKVALLARNDLFPLALAEEFTAYAKSKGLAGRFRSEISNRHGRFRISAD